MFQTAGETHRVSDVVGHRSGQHERRAAVDRWQRDPFARARPLASFARISLQAASVLSEMNRGDEQSMHGLFRTLVRRLFGKAVAGVGSSGFSGLTTGLTSGFLSSVCRTGCINLNLHRTKDIRCASIHHNELAPVAVS
jgi:hypothetical protein